MKIKILLPKVIIFLLPSFFSAFFFLGGSRGDGGVSLHAQNTRLWGTYYGDNANDFGESIATDASGNVYLAGWTASTSGIASGGYQNTYGGGLWDAFLVKFDAAGNRLWATYYGGTGPDIGYEVAIDASGNNVYLAGYTNSTIGIASGGHQNIYGGWTYDSFLVKFSASGGRLWATYYGGASDDKGYSAAVDAFGNVYLAGTTGSTNAIASGGFQNTHGGGTWDAFLVKFDAAGNRLWATYYGGTGLYDVGYSAVVDASDNVYLAGGTSSVGSIASGGFQNIYGGGSNDAFIVKFDVAGNRLWASYYGGTGNEIGWSAVTDASGNVYLAGETQSASGIASGGFQNTFGGSTEDAFLVKFSASGGRLWATYYGGNGEDRGYSTAVDASGNVYLAGYIAGSSTGIASGGFQNTMGGIAPDAFLVKFNEDGNRLCATYYGGTGNDYGYSTTLDVSGNVYLTGRAQSFSAIASGGYQNTLGGGTDAFLVKFCSCGSLCNVLTAIASSTNINCNGVCTGTAEVTATGGSPFYTYAWSPGGGTNANATGLCAGTYSVIVTDSAADTSTAIAIITEPTALTTTATATNSTCESKNGSATVNAGGGTPGYTYNWEPSGQTAPTATGLGSGTYTATVTDANGCTATQTVAVVSLGGSINTNQSASICSGTTYALPGGTVVSTGGIYNDTLVSVNGCDSIITTNLTVNPNPTATVLSNTTITQGQSVTLTALGGGTYSWSSGSTENIITVTPPATTMYCVTITDANNCSDTACVTITIESLGCSAAGKLYIPNAFSPNGDGENDMIKIYYGNYACIKTFKFVLYDRWGEKIFAATNPAFTWNGMYKDKLENTAVFVYYLEAMLISGEEIIRKGNISLIR